MTNDRIVLYYPDIMSEETARSFLEERRKALEFVENFLQVKLRTPLAIQVDVSLIVPSGAPIPWYTPAIIYQIPFCRIQVQSPATSLEGGVPAHEETHVVANYAWASIPSRPLKEGLAVALDFLSRPGKMVNPHLFAKGLALRGELIPIEALFSERFEAPLSTSLVQLYIYRESASFILFLIDHYGLEKLEYLYQASWTVIPKFEEDFHRIYGKDLTIVERDWYRFLESYAVGQETRAQYLAQAIINYSNRTRKSFTQLEVYWNRFPFQLVSPSEKVTKEYEAVVGLIVALGCSSREGMTRNDADDAYAAFSKALTAVESLLTTWLEGIHAFERLLRVMPDADDYEPIMAKLEAVRGVYQEVGDAGMVERVDKFIAAFQCLIKGMEAFAQGEPEIADGMLSDAVALFTELDQQAMVNKVNRLLEVYRYVTP